MKIERWFFFHSLILQIRCALCCAPPIDFFERRCKVHKKKWLPMSRKSLIKWKSNENQMVWFFSQIEIKWFDSKSNKKFSKPQQNWGSRTPSLGRLSSPLGSCPFPFPSLPRGGVRGGVSLNSSPLHTIFTLFPDPPRKAISVSGILLAWFLNVTACS